MLLTKRHQLCFSVVVGDQGQGDHAQTVARAALVPDGLDRCAEERLQ